MSVRDCNTVGPLRLLNMNGTLAVGINVGEWDSGLGVAIWLIVLPIAFAVVGALVLPAQRRRRRSGSVT